MVAKSTRLHISDWPSELSSFNERDISWCYNFFMNTPANIRSHEKEKILINFFDKNFGKESVFVNEDIYPLNYNVIIGLKQGNVVDLSWIDRKDVRLIKWMVSCGLIILKKDPIHIMAGHCGTYSVYTDLPTRSDVGLSFDQQYNFIIEYIDSVRFGYTDSRHKQDWVKSLKNYWARFKTPLVDIRWLDQHNEEQLLWAWNYLQDKSKVANLAPPVNTKEYYNVILASLDGMTGFEWSGEPIAEKKLFIANFKKAWSQKKFRAAGKTKKPYHLPLTIRAKSSLEKLAKVKGCSENEVLESLIDREYTSIFLDINGKEKY